MKILFNIFYGIFLFSIVSIASTRSDVKVIEASENIRLYGQKIAKDYLFYYKNSNKLDLKEQLLKDLKIIEESIIEIARITNSRDSKNILDFLAYNKDEIKTILGKRVNRENSILMLDYGETFLEGANSIENEHKYKFSTEEKMLISLKDMEYLLERTSKYYVAYSLNLDRKSNFENMSRSIDEIERLLKKINRYRYPNELLNELKKMNTVWSKHKLFLNQPNILSVPNLILSSESVLKKVVHKIALYHNQNQ